VEVDPPARHRVKIEGTLDGPIFSDGAQISTKNRNPYFRAMTIHYSLLDSITYHGPDA
jgi:hypothetical protein